jgi:hypothetical protein
MIFNPNIGTTQFLANDFTYFPTLSLAFLLLPNLYHTTFYFVSLLQNVNVRLDLPLGYGLYYCKVHHHFL